MSAVWVRLKDRSSEEQKDSVFRDKQAFGGERQLSIGIKEVE